MDSLLSQIPHIPGFLPITRENYDLLLTYWKWFPIIGIIQLLTPFYPTGKTSLPTSRFNIPGRLAWITMELLSPVLLLTTSLLVSTQVSHTSLPLQNILLIAMYLIHYSNRALIGPLLNNAMSPVHLLIWLLGIGFNFVNPVLIGGWLGGYGRVTSSTSTFFLGAGVWAVGFYGNLYHERILRGIRTKYIKISHKDKKEKDSIDKISDDVRIVTGRVYMIPRGGLFEYVLFPHYFCEWVEWAGFTLAAGGIDCLPALLFVTNEISTMLPRALQGKRWYKEKFGKKLPKDRKVVIPFLL
ncbi:3-oxo-5-alpha-steroid 4-dehydrogenase [Terfezia boudieri ATCC MYA-4762]|uniref:3-oxo-5-alpha-steroid 4-dehydrogenase n=1 Tax=Terfezia boudieri ATCC MYA-4762 TaxID=1051890 RepID=A0A3N4MJ62_9PEZI|nr:3-oxo-5-alpha-steroid 4-dehydrogenase [Terfezia boudieri ATCC MYA-4762]